VEGAPVDLNDLPDSAPQEAAPPTPPAPPAPPAQKKSLADRMIKGSAAVFAARIFLFMFGIVQAKALWHYFGQSALTDGFLFALEAVVMQFFLAAEKLIVPAFVPVFMEQVNKGSEEKAWETATGMLKLFALAIALVLVGLMVFPGALVNLFAWMTRKEFDPGRMAHVTFFVRWSSPTIMGLVLGSVTYAVMTSYKRFFLAAFGEAASKLCIIAGVLAAALAAGSASPAATKIMAAFLLAAGFARVGTHLWALRDKLGKLKPLAPLRSPAMRKYLILAAPLAIGVVVARGRDMFNGYGVMIVLEEGVLSANSYGRKIFTAVNGLVPFSVAIAMFPFFCEMVDRDDKAELGRFLTKACRMLLLVFAPMAAGVAVLSLPFFRAVFQSGRADIEFIRLAALANVCYVAVLPAQAIEAVIMQAFFSDRRMIAPTVIGIVMSSASVAWSWYAVAVLKLTWSDAIMAVALGYTASRYVKVVLLVVFLKKTIPAFGLRETLGFLARLLAVVTFTAGIAWELKWIYEGLVEVHCGTLTGMRLAARIGPQLAVASAAGLVFFLLGCRVLRLSELGEMLRWAREKLRRRGKASAGAGGVD